MDIGVVIANAGVAGTGAYVDFSDDDLQSMVNINALQVTYVFKVMAEQLIKR